MKYQLCVDATKNMCFMVDAKTDIEAYATVCKQLVEMGYEEKYITNIHVTKSDDVQIQHNKTV